MGRIAGERARIVVVTDEDPRGEDRDADPRRDRAGRRGRRQASRPRPAGHRRPPRRDRGRLRARPPRRHRPARRQGPRAGRSSAPTARSRGTSAPRPRPRCTGPATAERILAVDGKHDSTHEDRRRTGDAAHEDAASPPPRGAARAAPRSSRRDRRAGPDLEALRADALRRDPRASTPAPTSSRSAAAFDLAVEAHEGQKRATGEPYVTHPIASAQILAELGHRPDRDPGRAPPRRPGGHRVQPDRRRGALRRRGRPARRRRHQAVQVQHPQPRAAAGREHPQDAPGDGRGHPGRPDQARRPAPQHAHAVRPAVREAAAHRPPDDGDLRAAGRAARDLADEVGARGPRLQGARARALPRAGQAARHPPQGPRDATSSARSPSSAPKLEAAGIEADLQGRPKHIYSIWKKMQRKGAEFGEIYDVYAIRLWSTTSATATRRWASSTRSGGRSRASSTTTSRSPRTTSTSRSTPRSSRSTASRSRSRSGPTQMHQVSEVGIAAHWRYKEGTKSDREYDAKLAWLRQLHGLAARRRRRDRVRRGHQARHLPGPGLRVHAEGRHQGPAGRRDAARLRLPDPHRRRPPDDRRQGQQPAGPARLPAARTATSSRS